MNKVIKNFLVSLLLLSCAFAATPASAAFQPIKNIEGGTDQTGAFLDNSGYEGADQNSAASVIATVIKAFLGLLGVIFIFLVIVAGYKYMTANGDEGKVEEALDRIKTAVIGLIIILSAYAITAFVFKNLPDSAGSGNNSPTVE